MNENIEYLQNPSIGATLNKESTTAELPPKNRQ